MVITATGVIAILSNAIGLTLIMTAKTVFWKVALERSRKVVGAGLLFIALGILSLTTATSNLFIDVVCVLVPIFLTVSGVAHFLDKTPTV